ncbi:hypothetical protein P4S65_09860 [Pseudoalteromonas sp. B131b]|uniref:hypothetical protein n=1 Tax=Pseudoalteromonas sp. B131b TaxID=630493 RepID=UPI00301D12A5
MTDGTLEKFKYRSGALLATLVLLILGLGLLVLYAFSDNKSSIEASVLSQLSSVFLIGGVWGGIYELILRQEFIKVLEKNSDKILNRLSAIDHEEEIGLTHSFGSSGAYDYGDIIKNSEVLRVVLNDGRTWISNNLRHLEERFKDEKKKTTIFLQHPDSNMVEIICKKVGSDESSFRIKIRESIKMIQEISTKGDHIRIVGHHYFNPQSTFLSEHRAVVTPYYYSKARKTPPVLCFKKTSTDCYYSRLRQDLKALEADCEDLWDYE